MTDDMDTKRAMRRGHLRDLEHALSTMAWMYLRLGQPRTARRYIAAFEHVIGIIDAEAR